MINVSACTRSSHRTAHQVQSPLKRTLIPLSAASLETARIPRPEETANG